MQGIRGEGDVAFGRLFLFLRNQGNELPQTWNPKL